MAETLLQSQTQTVAVATQATLQSRVSNDTASSGLGLFTWAVNGAFLIPPWWSEARDRKLRTFWKQSDHLSGAMFTMVSKMYSIPFRIVPRDVSNLSWAREAVERQHTLRYSSEFGEGWGRFYQPFLEDLLASDKGAFAEIIAPGNPAGPISGTPISIAHLDSANCQLTGVPEFPVIYRDPSGKSYKLHFSRVIHISQMPSPASEMNGVGLCSVSRCVNVAQNLIDILLYKQEKLGSRPHRGVMVTQGGLDPDDVTRAFQLADSTMDNQGLSRYSRIAVVGERSLPEANLALIELSGLPDGFDEQSSIALGMATIALAFGVDARELFPAMQSGATRADALLQHIKQRGKGPGQIITSVEDAINFKFLPPYLKIEFEYQDDAEDRQAAEIHEVRSKARQSNLTTKVTNLRSERQSMWTSGEISEEQFSLLELADGRLQDGTDILSLFYKDSSGMSALLDLGVAEPDNILANDAAVMMPKILSNLAQTRKAIANVNSAKQKVLLMQVQAALEKLYKMYETGDIGAEVGAEADAETAGMPYNDPRMRREDLTSPNPAVELSAADSLRPGKDDAVKSASIVPAYLSRLDDIYGELVAQSDEQDGLRKQGKLAGLQANWRARHPAPPPTPQPITVNVTPPSVTVNLPESQPQFTVNVPKQAPPVVTVNTPKQTAPQVTVNVPKQAAPVVTVNVPEQPVRKERDIIVNVPAQGAPVVHIDNKVEFPSRAHEVVVVNRDADGKIISTESDTEFDNG